MPGGAHILAAQALALVLTFFQATWSAALSLPTTLLTIACRMLLPGCDGRCDGRARFYEGTVAHARKQPKAHSFTCAGGGGGGGGGAAGGHPRGPPDFCMPACLQHAPTPLLPLLPTAPCSYQVRMAVVDLDNAPSWWKRGKNENMGAAEARLLAGTSGGWPGKFAARDGAQEGTGSVAAASLARDKSAQVACASQAASCCTLLLNAQPPPPRNAPQAPCAC